MKKKTIWKGIFIFSIIACLLCLTGLIWYLYQDRQAKEEYETLQEQVVMKTTETSETAEESGMTKNSEISSATTGVQDAMGSLEEPTLEEVENIEFTGEREGEAAVLPENIFLDMENPINFETLQSINSDIYAWIRIPGTEIDYPIAQRAGDDTYYLSHDIYNKPRFAGSIYTEDCNSKDFTDPNTVIYGHNMRNESMFQNLHKFEERDFLDAHPYVYIYTPDRVLLYEIFAAYTYDDRHLMNSFDFQNRDVFGQYLQSIQTVRSMNKNIRQDISVTADDKIITLVTCIGSQTNSRYLVQAVLVQG